MPQDRYADAKAIPPIDEQQDYELTGFQESGGKTLLKFKRKFDTCDTRDRKLEVSFFCASFSVDRKILVVAGTHLWYEIKEGIKGVQL